MNQRFKLTQVAEIVGIHPNTLRLWVRNGMVSHVLLPTGRIQFEREHVQEIVDSIVEKRKKTSVVKA